MKRSNLILVISYYFTCLFVANAQVPWSPFYSPPVSFNEIISSGTTTRAACNSLLNTVNVSGTANYDTKARHYIRFLPGTNISSLSTGSFHAHIEPAPFEVVSYHPNGFNNIPQYDKFELGIKLPQNLTDSINSFFGAVNTVSAGFSSQTTYTCKNGYGNVFDVNFINPYDPDQISIEATFSFPNKQDQTIYGFYYRDYSYSSGNAVPSYMNTDWVEDTTLQYHWRVRFAPKFVGTYHVSWVIKRNNQVILSDQIGQNFTTASSNSLGYLKLGTNKKFLVTQPNENDPQKTIIPVGVCAATVPRRGDKEFNQNDQPPTPDCYLQGCLLPNCFFPSRFYWYRENILRQMLANSGGNYVRIYNTVDCFASEWEKAGVYDASPVKPLAAGIQTASGYAKYKGVNRQAMLWEFDRVLDMAKEEGLYIQYVMEDHASNGFGGIMNADFAWTEHPYYKSVISSPNSSVIDQFFGDADAIKAYKKKLRYFFARCGYSTNLTSIEMINELHNFKKPQYVNLSSSLNDLPRNWLQTMTTYIKDSLKQKDQLLTVSYEWGEEIDEGNDIIGSINSFDFLSRHPYDLTKNFHYDGFFKTREFRLKFLKPCQPGELGYGADWGCVANKNFVTEFLGPKFHSMLWSTVFMGGLTSGLDNWTRGLFIDPVTDMYHVCGDGYRQHLKPVQSFLKDIDFDAANYVPRYFRSNDNLETFYMLNNNSVASDHAIGFVRNRTFWWRNFMIPNAPFYDDSLAIQFPNYYGTCSLSIDNPEVVASGVLGSVVLSELSPSTSLVVDWYDTFNDPPQLITSIPFQVNGQGIALITPPLFVSNSCFNQEYAFKIHPPGLQRQSNFSNQIDSLLILNSTTTVINNTKDPSRKFETDFSCKIFPNPGSGNYSIVMSDKDEFVLEIYNSFGSLIKEHLFSEIALKVNIEEASNGIYIFKIKGKGGTYVQKVVKSQ